MLANSKPPSGFLDLITGKLGKLTAGVLAIAALGTAMITLTDVWGRFATLFSHHEAPPPPPDPKNCFAAKLSYPATVPLSQWDSMELRLSGKNECKAALAVYVSFRGRADRIRLEPPYDAPDPQCWEHKTVPSGAVDWSVSPPRLVPLKVPLGDKVRVDINWVVYNVETKAQVGADTAKFWLEDDNPPIAAKIAATSPL